VTAGSTQTGSYDEQDRVTSYGGYTFTYTANGEIESKTGPAGTTTYRYDPFGNLAGVTLPSGTVVDYILDGRHRRVAKKVNGTVTQKFLYADGLRPIAQLAADDSLVYQFLYAERSNAPSLIIGPSGTYRVVSNHLGSPRAIIDIATGASLRSSYDEFGNVTSDTNPAFQPFAFAGGLYDSDTHLVHFGAREYDATLGRFTSRDPLGFGGGQANVYDYAANDPINFVDPSGLLFGGSVDAGEEYGSDAVDQYADWLTDPNAGFWQKFGSAIGGTFAALWTPCTSDATFNTLLIAEGAGRYLARPYWRYIGPNSSPQGRWLTRGWGWRARYGEDFVAAKDALQLPYLPEEVIQVRPGMFEPVAGPRGVSGFAEFGNGGGVEYYRGSMSFPPPPPIQ